MSKRKLYSGGSLKSDQTAGIERGKKYKWNTSGEIEEVTSSSPAADDEIVITGTKSNLRRMADMERNISILATSLYTEDSSNAKAATKSYVNGKIADLIDAAPGALNTLNELAASLNDDADFASTMTSALSGKVGTTSVQALHGTDALSISGHTITLKKGDGTTESVIVPDNNTDTHRGIHDTPVNGATTISISSNWAYDNVKTPVPSGALFTDTNNYLTGMTFNTGNGILTATRAGLSDVTVDLDGRYALAHSHPYDNYNGWDLFVDSSNKGRISSGENVNFVAGSNVSLGYSTTNNAITINSSYTDTNTNQLTTWDLQGDSGGATTIGHGETVDIAGGSNVTTVRSGNTITINATDTNTNQLTTWNVQGDSGGATTIGHGETVDIAGGSNVTTSRSGNTITINATDTNTDTIDMGDGFKIANSGGTDQFTVTENEEIRFAGSGATSVSFDAATQKVTISSTDTNTDTNTNKLTTFQVEDGDGTEVTMSHGKEWKFLEGNDINVNWTDTSNGSDTDPFDLQFSHKNTTRSNTTSSATPANGGTVSVVDGVTTNSRGHVTGVNTKTVTLPSETLTSLSHDTVAKELTYIDEAGNATDISLAQYIDDTNLSRLTNGTLAGGTLTMNRDDGTSFTVNLSSLLDDTVANDGTVTVTGGTGLTGSGAFTMNQAHNETVTIHHADTSSQSSVNNSGRTYIQDITLDSMGHITGISSATETVVDTNTNKLTTWELQGDSGGPTTIGHNEIVDIAGGTNVTTVRSGNTITINSSYTDTNNYLTGMTFNTGNGILTATRSGLSDVTVDLDGRYALSHSHPYLPLSGGTMTGDITTNEDIISTSRDNGVFGSYNSTLTDHIWSMGTSYRNHASGTNFGNLYGLAYKHTNNTTGGNMGGSHQMVWCTNGSPRGAIGHDYVWHTNGMRVGSSNHTVWHAGNDGHGSGLDADLLDGQHGSYYYSSGNPPPTYSKYLRSDISDNAAGRIQFSANASNNWDTIATSSGSQGSLEVYNTGAGNDAFMAFHAGGDYAGYFGLDADTNDLAWGGWSVGAVKHRMWHAGNDGHGSGLDADLLDGKQGSEYALVHSHPYDNYNGWDLYVNSADKGRISSGENVNFIAGSNVSLAYSSTNNAITINSSYTDTNTTYSAGRGLDLSGTQFLLETDLRDSISYIGYDSNDYIQWSNNSWTRTVVAGTERLRVDTAGIDVSGRIVADGDICAYSDARLKEDVEVIEGALDKVDSLKGVNFTRIEDKTRSTGLIAQDVLEVLPEAVKTDDEGMHSLAYGNIVGLLVEAIKELKAEVDTLKNNK